MSRFVLGNCIDVMARIPDNAIDFILTDPPYLVGFRDRSGSFYGWNRVDRFMAAWKNAGFSVVGHLVFTKNYITRRKSPLPACNR